MRTASILLTPGEKFGEMESVEGESVEEEYDDEDDDDDSTTIGVITVREVFVGDADRSLCICKGESAARCCSLLLCDEDEDGAARSGPTEIAFERVAAWLRRY